MGKQLNMTKLTEDKIEKFAIESLVQLGYEYLYAVNKDQSERDDYETIILWDPLEQAIDRLNPKVSPDAQEEVINTLKRFDPSDLLTDNEAFHRRLTEGITVPYQKEGYERGDQVWLIDFETPENNDFVVANQFSVVEGKNEKRLDLLLFVNGLPLVVMEFKNPTAEQATLKSAYRQIQTYKTSLPKLFSYNAFMVISDGLEARAGTLSAEFSRFMDWKTADGKVMSPPWVSPLETLIKGMLNKATLLDLIRHFTVFEKTMRKDPQTGVTSIGLIKKLAAYHQYYAVNKAVESTLRAADYSGESPLEEVAEAPEHYGMRSAQGQPRGDRKAGVVWHTQGSGKSLSMVFFTGKIVLALHNPTLLVLTDRNDLDDQLFNTFAASTQLLRQAPRQAEGRKELKELLKVKAGGIVFSTLQKFHPEEAKVFETLSTRENLIVIADEAHRSQYGFAAKEVDIKDEKGVTTAKDTRFGFAK